MWYVEVHVYSSKFLNNQSEIIRNIEIGNSLFSHFILYCPLSFYNPITKWWIIGHIFLTKTLISHKIKAIEQNKEKGSKKTSCKLGQYKNMGSIFNTFENLALFVIRAFIVLKTHHLGVIVSIFLIISGFVFCLFFPPQKILAHPNHS